MPVGRMSFVVFLDGRRALPQFVPSGHVMVHGLHGSFVLGGFRAHEVRGGSSICHGERVEALPDGRWQQRVRVVAALIRVHDSPFHVVFLQSSHAVPAVRVDDFRFSRSVVGQSGDPAVDGIGQRVKCRLRGLVDMVAVILAKRLAACLGDAADLVAYPAEGDVGIVSAMDEVEGRLVRDVGHTG